MRMPLIKRRSLLTGLLWLTVQTTGQAQTPAPDTKPPVAAPGTVAHSEDKLIAGVQAESLWDGRKLVPFHALDNPKMVQAASADFLGDDEYVLGLAVNGEARAYPTRFLWWHHIINDRIGKPSAGGEVPIAVTYCSVCNSGMGFNTSLDGKSVLLDFFGLYNGVAIYCERQTDSVFFQVSHEFVRGGLAGRKLTPRPVLDTTWGQWKTLHPDTLVMSPDSPYRKYYRERGQPEPRDYQEFPAPFFAPTLTRADKRLPAFDKVLGVTLAGRGDTTGGEVETHRAYPIKAMKDAGGVVNDTLNGTPVVALLDGETVSGSAFGRTLDGKTLTLEARKGAEGKVTFADRETGTTWNLEGYGTSGPLKGKSLPRLDSQLSQWYGWVAYFPQTGLYGHDEPPQPIAPSEVSKSAK